MERKNRESRKREYSLHLEMFITWYEIKKRTFPLCTILSEFSGGELCGDPEGLLGTTLENEARGDAGAAVEVLLTAGQAQVESMVIEGRVLITLRPTAGKKSN